MSEQVNKINWFPGHMKKATEEIIKRIQTVDLIIEVLDARAPMQSSNPELVKIANQKPIIQIALKKDLSDIDESDFKDILFGSTKDGSFKKRVIEELNFRLADKIARQKKKGLLVSQFLVMVIGVPNVGKSSLINFLAPKKVLKVENRAGVTKNQATRKINDNFFLIDTPGVLVKKIDNIEDGYRLSIINCINKTILPMHDVIKFCHHFFVTNYKRKMDAYFDMEVSEDYKTFLDQICDKYQYKQENNQQDYERAFDKLFLVFSNASICKYNFN
ncbi:MAG: ribosome biogenesis GTPase YlqF [Mycoplasma sp.]